MDRSYWLGIGLVYLLIWPNAAPAQYSDCRLELGKLPPVIATYNPFFSQHRWSPASRLETARMSLSRYLIITQEGCKRHHIHFDLLLDIREVVATDSFWIATVFELMDKVYFEDTVYDGYRQEFEELFEEKFRLSGTNRRFNFPIGTRNFICFIQYDPGTGAKVSIEQIEFLFKEQLALPKTGISPEEDDGWRTPKGY